MKKIMIIKVCFIFAIIFTLVALLFANLMPKLKLKQDIFKVEYGEKISDKIETYISDDFKLVEDIILDLNVENEEEKDFPAVGEYKGSISYKDTVLKFKVIVEDTKAPQFINLNKNISIEANAENVQFERYFEVIDLSEVTLSVDIKDVDLSKEGSYELNVSAEDEYKNKTTETINVTVINKEKADKGEATKYADGSAAPKAKEEKKEDSKTTQNSSSSDSSTSSSSSSSKPSGGSSSSSGNSGSSGGNSSSGNSGSSSGTTVTFPEGYNQGEAMVVYNTINQLRRQEGLVDLPYDSSLQWMADNRAKAIISNFSHDGSYSKMGLTEVIAQMGTGQGSAAYGWRNSPGHWFNLTYEENTGIAVSCYQHKGYYFYVAIISYNAHSYS